jgi:hypothetical protein
MIIARNGRYLPICPNWKLAEAGRLGAFLETARRTGQGYAVAQHHNLAPFGKFPEFAPA